MSTWLPQRFDRGSSGSEGTTLLVVDDALDRTRRAWEVGTARWRACAMAEAIFGGPVVAKIDAVADGRGAFRGMVSLHVPFSDLGLHQWREDVFQACAAADPVLGRVPVLFIFQPRIVEPV